MPFPQERVALQTWCQGNVLMKLFCSILHESWHQDIQAGAHMERLNSRSCCGIQAQLHIPTR